MNYPLRGTPSGLYVYAYIRSVTSKTSAAGTPYYVGLGSKDRAIRNHNHIPTPSKEFIVICEHQLTEVGAIALERRLIQWWGRKDIGTGILLNRTEGGEGSRGRSVESRKKTSDANKRRKGIPLSKKRIEALKITHSIVKGKKQTSDHIEKRKVSGIKNGMFGKTHTDEVKQILSKLSKGRIVSAETRKKMSESNKGIAKEKYQCPNCQKEIAGASNAKRWHFDNCKLSPFKSKI